MGCRPADMIEKAAKYLVSILMEKGKIDYDYFYDGEERTRSKLIEGIGITCEQADRHCAEALMDNAAYELEEQDVVEIEEIDSILADGNPNYRITLTEKGREKITNGEKLEFYPAE